MVIYAWSNTLTIYSDTTSYWLHLDQVQTWQFLYQPQITEFLYQPVQEMESTPGPKYSTIAPVPPLTVRIPATLRMTSLGEVHPDNSPVSLTPITWGLEMLGMELYSCHDHMFLPINS